MPEDRIVYTEASVTPGVTVPICGVCYCPVVREMLSAHADYHENRGDLDAEQGEPQ